MFDKEQDITEGGAKTSPILLLLFLLTQEGENDNERKDERQSVSDSKITVWGAEAYVTFYEGSSIVEDEKRLRTQFRMEKCTISMAQES